jgi:hypothetical protein
MRNLTFVLKKMSTSFRQQNFITITKNIQKTISKHNRKRMLLLCGDCNKKIYKIEIFFNVEALRRKLSCEVTHFT